MSDRTRKISSHMSTIIDAIDNGTANSERVMRACCIAIRLLCEEVDLEDDKNTLNVFRDMFGGMER